MEGLCQAQGNNGIQDSWRVALVLFSDEATKLRVSLYTIGSNLYDTLLVVFHEARLLEDSSPSKGQNIILSK